MASTHGLSTRLHAMEARLDCVTDKVEQSNVRMDQMGAALHRAVAVNHAMLDMMYQLQPLANFLSPLSNELNPRDSCAEDSGLGDVESSVTEEVELYDTCSTSSRPAPLRRRRGRSNLKRLADPTPSLKTAEKGKAMEMTEVPRGEPRTGLITICMMQDAPRQK